MKYGYRRTRSHSDADSGRGLSQIAFDTPRQPKRATSAERLTVVTSCSEAPMVAAALAASSATAAEWPSVYGDFRSTNRLIAVSASSHSAGDSAGDNAGSASITASKDSVSSSS